LDVTLSAPAVHLTGALPQAEWQWVLDRLQMPNEERFRVLYPLWELSVEPVNNDTFLARVVDTKLWQSLLAQLSYSDSGLDTIGLRVKFSDARANVMGVQLMLALLLMSQSNLSSGQTQSSPSQTLRRFLAVSCNQFVEFDEFPDHTDLLRSILKMLRSRTQWTEIGLSGFVLTNPDLTDLVDGLQQNTASSLSIQLDECCRI
jgi:hypothetical protein